MRVASKSPRPIVSTVCMTVALATTVLVTACTPDFDDVWQVRDLRVLGIRADPPEVLLPPTALFELATLTLPSVRVDALVVDPRDDDTLVEWQIVACTPEENLCDDAKVSKRVYPPEGEGEWARTRLDEIGFDFVLDNELALAAIGADLFKGFGGLPIPLELRVRGAEEVVGQKRLVYGITDPPNKAPNRNPRLAGVTIHGTEIADPEIPDPWVVGREEKIVVLPEPGVGSKEDYVVLTFSGDSKDLEEHLSYSFFVTEGELSHGKTGGRPSPFVVNKKVVDVTSEWTTPKEPGEGTVWVVVRDGRGGVDWRSFRYRVE